MRRPILAAVFLLGCGDWALAQDGFSLQGKVVDAQVGTELPEARVSCGAVSQATDAKGQFELSLPDSGLCTLKVSAKGYVAAPGVERPYRYGPGLGKKELTLRMERVGQVAGLVETAKKKPVVRIPVVLAERKELPKGFLYYPKLFTQTDSTGAFAFPAVPPGTYYIVAAPPVAGAFPLEVELGKAPRQLTKTFYPKSPAGESGIPVEVRAGANLTGMTVEMETERVFPVSGVVAGVSEQELRDRPYYVVLERRLELHPEYADLLYGLGGRRSPSARIAPDGTFRIAEVGEGFYLAKVQQALKQYSAYEVGFVDRELTKLQLSTEGALRLRGKVVLETEGEKKELPKSIFFSATSGLNVAVPVSAEGMFDVDGVGPGDYSLSFTGADQGRYYVKSVKRKIGVTQGARLKLAPFEEPDTEILVSTRFGKIVGTAAEEGALQVSLKGRPFTGDATSSTRLFGVDQFGRFELEGVVPGAYRVCAWKETGDAMVSAQMLTANEAKLKDVCEAVEVGESKTVNVRLPKVVSVGGFGK